MKIFLDTANLEDIRKYNDMGLLDGITTNPTLLAKEGGDPQKSLNIGEFGSAGIMVIVMYF